MSHAGPAVKTAAGRVFYGGGGISPDIEQKPLNFTPQRARVAEAAFQFTRQLAAGLVPGLEMFKVEKVQYGRNPKASDYAITERVLEAFRAWVRLDVESQLTPAQLEEEADFVKLRLREEIITAAFSNDAGARVLLDSDPQVLRAFEASLTPSGSQRACAAAAPAANHLILLPAQSRTSDSRSPAFRAGLGDRSPAFASRRFARGDAHR